MTKRRGLALGAASIIVVFCAIAYTELFAPPGGVYGNTAARYWIGRAADETSRSEKERHISRVALSSEYGSHIAMQAIRHVEDRRERCVLRTILAGLPNVRAVEERRAEAATECVATPETPGARLP